MDKLIARFDAKFDGDLMLVPERGVAYQGDMSVRASYDGDYFDKCAGYVGSDIAKAINAGRVDLVNRHAGADTPVLDIGVGSGEFIKNRSETWGFDINPKAVKWLRSEGKWADDLTRFSAFTFWDVIEHVEDPNWYFKRIPDGGYAFFSIPVFDDLTRIRESKHYRPGEHLYYWTPQGFIDWLALYRFELLEVADYETEAGRESIKSFAFRRSLPGYNETVGQYQQLHSEFYGASAGLYFDEIAKVVLEMNPASILDYGCGRSDLAAHFWNDGKRRIAKYDPAIPEHKDMPEGKFGMVICTDVLEHIRMEDVDRVLQEIKAKSGSVLFTISMKPARAKLPDGRNAHVTLLNASEWTRWIKSVFGKAERVPLEWDHILMLRTF